MFGIYKSFYLEGKQMQAGRIGPDLMNFNCCGRFLLLPYE